MLREERLTSPQIIVVKLFPKPRTVFNFMKLVGVEKFKAIKTYY